MKRENIRQTTDVKEEEKKMIILWPFFSSFEKMLLQTQKTNRREGEMEFEASKNQIEHEEELHLVSNGVCLLFLYCSIYSISPNSIAAHVVLFPPFKANKIFFSDIPRKCVKKSLQNLKLFTFFYSKHNKRWRISKIQTRKSNFQE